MRIALCGRGGTGKTTLAAELSRRLALPMISEQVRVAARRLGIERIDRLHREERILLQGVALACQSQAEAAYHESGFVSDRSRWDYLAYYRELIGGESVHAYEQLAHRCAYDALILVEPHGGQREDDGFRFGDAFARIEDEVAVHLVRFTAGTNRLFLGPGTIEQRVGWCLDFLRKDGEL